MEQWKLENSTSEHIPYAAQVNCNTVKTIGGDYLQVIKLEGVPHETSDHEDVVAWKDQLNTLLKNIALSNICIWSTTIRRRTSEYPAGEYDSEFDRKLNEKYKKNLQKNRFLVNELYLTIIYRPEQAAVKLFKKASYTKEQGQIAMENAIENINEIQRIITSSLTEYSPRLLGTYTKIEKRTKKGILHSEILEFFDYIINGNQTSRALTPKPLNTSLARARPFFGKDAFELRDVTESVVGAIIAINDYPESTEAGLLNSFLSAPFELILTQSFNFISKPVAKDMLKKQRNRMNATDDDAQSQIDAIDIALDDITANRIVFGEHHLSLTVLAANEKELKKNLSEARAALAEPSIIVAREDWALAAAFWAQLPGNTKYRPRPAPISSKNFAGLSSFHNYPRGQKDGNQWGPAVTVFKTSSGSEYYFNFHEWIVNRPKHHKALGNTLIAGPSSSGKTVVQGFLMSQSKKFFPIQIVFDKDRGLEIYVLLSGGVYLPLQYGKPTGFNPFKLDNTPKNVDFLVSLVKNLLNTPLTPEEEGLIHDGVKGVISQQELYRLSDLFGFLPERLKPYLKKWCHDGELSWVFDNEDDLLDLKANKMFGFDVTEFLEKKEIRTPIIMYLFHKIEELLDGTPIQIFLDEFWRLLDDEYFIEFAKNKSKVIRKQNGIIVYGTQSLSDITESDISRTLIEQCSTVILMPNDRANKKDYVDDFNCTNREFEIIKEEISVQSRQFLIKQNGKSVVAELNLAGFDDELSIISGTTDNVLRLERLREKTSDTTELTKLFLNKDVMS